MGPRSGFGLAPRPLARRSLGEEVLRDIVDDYLDLLDTTAAVHERDGEFAVWERASSWCRMLEENCQGLCRLAEAENTRRQRHCEDSCSKPVRDGPWKQANRSMRKVVAECGCMPYRFEPAMRPWEPMASDTVIRLGIRSNFRSLRIVAECRWKTCGEKRPPTTRVLPSLSKSPRSACRPPPS